MSVALALQHSEGVAIDIWQRINPQRVHLPFSSIHLISFTFTLPSSVFQCLSPSRLLSHFTEWKCSSRHPPNATMIEKVCENTCVVRLFVILRFIHHLALLSYLSSLSSLIIVWTDKTLQTM